MTEQRSDKALIQFVDDLFEKLHTERQEMLTKAAIASRSRERVAEAARVSWDEFCQPNLA